MKLLMKYIIAAAAAGIIFAVLSYVNQGQGRDMFAAMLAAAAVLFLFLCVGMFFGVGNDRTPLPAAVVRRNPIRDSAGTAL